MDEFQTDAIIPVPGRIVNLLCGLAIRMQGGSLPPLSPPRSQEGSLSSPRGTGGAKPLCEICKSTASNPSDFIYHLAGQLAPKKRPLDVGDPLRDPQVNFGPQTADRGVTLIARTP